MKTASLKQIIAIGGGGFARYERYMAENLLMESYLLKQTNKSHPHICFIPTASGESLKYIVDFYRAFNQLPCRPSHLSLFDPPTGDLASFLLEKDIIYVGGGNTKSMLALWREWQLDKIIKEAWEKGIVLCGVSAGSLCWFEEGVTDSIPGPLTRLKCLGFLPGSNCPHYDGEKDRRPSYHRLIRAGMLPGYAADDEVGLHFIGTELHKIVRTNKSGCGYRVELKEDKVIETPLLAEILT
jgi:dipeptidase E